MDSRWGVFIAKANIDLGEDSSVPAKLFLGKINMFPVPPSVFKLYGLMPGAANSQKVSVKVNKSVGHTEIVGLRFKQEVTLHIWVDGTVEVDKEKIFATDNDGGEWVLKKVRVGGKVAIVMISKTD